MDTLNGTGGRTGDRGKIGGRRVRDRQPMLDNRLPGRVAVPNNP